MIIKLIRDVKTALSEIYDEKLVVIVNPEYYDEFIHIANCFSVKVQVIKEPDHYIVVMGMKDKKYLPFMKTIQYEHGMNLSENVSVNGSNPNGLITELIAWKDRAT